MDLFTAVIHAAIAQAQAAREGMNDYLGTDGLMHCGRCHERVEMPFDKFPGYTKVPVTCSCIRGQRPEPPPEQTGELSEDEDVARLIDEARQMRR